MTDTIQVGNLYLTINDKYISNTIQDRLNCGWTENEAITIPIISNHRIIRSHTLGNNTYYLVKPLIDYLEPFFATRETIVTYAVERRKHGDMVWWRAE